MSSKPAPRAYGAQASERAAAPRVDVETKVRSWSSVASNIAWFTFSTSLVYFFDVINVQLYSQRIMRSVLYAAYACFAVMFGVGMYMTWFVGRHNKDWDKDPKYERQIQASTLAMVVGCVLWVVAMWPVFHLWTIPLGVLCTISFITAMTFMPSGPAKRKHA